jgi:hypothetical protein
VGGECQIHSTGKPIDLAWLWFRSPHHEPSGHNDADF